MRPTRRLSFFRWLGIGLVADGLAYLLGAAWRGFVRASNAMLRAGGWSELDMQRGFAVTAVRIFGEALLDYGGAVYNAKHPAFGCVGDNSADDTAGLLLWKAAANARSVDPTNHKRSVGTKVYLPIGQYRCTAELAFFPGVLIEGAGDFASVIIFERNSTDKGVTFDVGTTGHTAWSGFGWGGGITDLTLTTKSYLVAGQTCGTLLKVKGVAGFHARNLALLECAARNLHIEDCLNSSFTKILASVSDGDCNVFLGGTSTTIAFRTVWATQCRNGPAWDLTGISVSLTDTCVAESCGTVTPSGAYGVKLNYGTCTISGMHFEDCADHDIYVGYTDYPASGRTTVTITNPTFLTGPTKVANKGGIYLNYCDHATLAGGSISAATYPLRINDTAGHCGEVWVSADFGGGSLVPVLDSDPLLPSVTPGYYRKKLDLYWANHSNRTQSKNKTGIAPAGTAVLVIPVSTSSAPFLRVYAEVYYVTSNGLRTGVKIDIFKEGDSNTDGGAVVTVLGTDSPSGNFAVAGTDFVTTFQAGTVTVTYTCTNISGNNFVEFQVEGLGIAGDLTIT